ncbi:RNA polymerase II transcriptional coactivator [Trichinella pseudospiralis]|uniref:RNA polymerase II transcriptional coactivator n=2 Tax=Trichinella pseudospiralis TaxID=6337 RepID=A0A0V1G0G4_TRIPS|nr:RNA polymerase II transcriptional coactivator [Trichinella pseudospiralis]KRY77974.1 RNA polymerase II transcriptional coactivator [Trichinella pseudospiralis]KRY91800.1 RNA polymerase II transcriptional coactivator [Trichinella pseudospiralis]KRZ29898.1 RNA polymerase II transcriptional coactivator [Trichinella pseudospiralis]KRZ44253.1 RNA polymerase II transcriptional coactivator [Trichinella pseudospiralis]
MSDSLSSSGPEDRLPPKNKKKGNKPSEPPAKKGKIEQPEESDEFKLDLGGRKFVHVNEFRGRKRVDIREYFQANDGQVRPTKKGISLSYEQFQLLLDSADKIKDKLRDY